jgi:hypothetical protein
MSEKEKFEKIKSYIDLLVEGRKTGKIRFKDVTQKDEMGKIYQSIYHVNPVMSCDNCVRFYLDQLEAYYQREHPKYLKTLPEILVSTDLKTESNTNIQATNGKASKVQENTKVNTKKNKK